MAEWTLAGIVRVVGCLRRHCRAVSRAAAHKQHWILAAACAVTTALAAIVVIAIASLLNPSASTVTKRTGCFAERGERGERRMLGEPTEHEQRASLPLGRRSEPRMSSDIEARDGPCSVR